MTQLKDFKFVTTLILVFKKIENEDKTKYETCYLSSKAEIIVNKSAIGGVFQSIYVKIISKMQKSLRKSSCWITDSVMVILTLFQSIII